MRYKKPGTGDAGPGFYSSSRDCTHDEKENLQTRLLAVHAEPASVSNLKTETSVQRFRRRVRTDDLQVGVGSAPVVTGFKE